MEYIRGRGDSRKLRPSRNARSTDGSTIPRIFLSYARGDDEPYTRSVYERLLAEGFDAWFDREDMPSRALTFLQEIRDAVRSRDRLLVVLGPAAVLSDYVRAEWQAALVDGKVVTPVLRLGDYDLVPPELKNLHCPDVRPSRPPEEAFGELLRILRDPVPPLGSLMGPVPEMPAHFQPRPDDLSALADTLLYDIERPAVIDGPLRTTVVHGMGGVGKSVLAGAFARSSSARRVFGDGIIWVTATPTTQPLELVRSVLLLTGSPVHADAGLAEAVTTLRSWLDARRCLIVVDNVWRVEQAAPIVQALSRVSRLLLTSRDAGLATALGANTRPLDVLAPEAALRQLADWVGARPDNLPAEALAVARETGYLPLALALQGALARDGVDWADLLYALRHAELDFAEEQFPDYPYPNLLASLRVSVDVLRSENAAAATRFVELAAFFWDDGVPEAALTRFWAYGPQGIPEHRGRKLLVTLERKALLRLEGVTPHRRVRLHDLMVDFLAACGDPVAANGKLVDAYRAACRTDWPDGPDDGYFLEHLLDHLARLPDGHAELHRLLRLEDGQGHHAWFEAVDAAVRVDQFRRQLERLLADPATSDPETVRIALLLGSLTARAANIPAPLLDALIACGIWSLPRALDYARQLPLSGRRGFATDAGMRMRALLVVAEHLPESERYGMVDEALAAAGDANPSTPGLPDLARTLAAAGRTADALTIARRESHGEERTIMLAAVAMHAEPTDRDAIIAEALEDCTKTLDLFRSAALEPLVPLLDAAGVQSALVTVVEPLANPVARGWCQIYLANRLAELGLVTEALALARSIQDTVCRAEALAILVPSLLEDARDAAIDDVLQTAVDIDEDRWRSDMERSFDDLPPMLASVQSVIWAEQSWRPDTLRSLAPYLDGASLATAMRLVQETTDRHFLAEGAAAMAGALSEAARANLVGHAAQQVREIENTKARARAVATIVPVLETPYRVALLEETLNIIATQEEPIVVEALSALAAVLTPEHIPRALELVRQVADVEARVSLVEAMVPVLEPTHLPTARAIIEMVSDRDEVLLASAALAEYAGADRHRAILWMAAGHEEYVRARTLALLVPQVDDDVLDDALQILATITHPTSLAEIALPVFARRVEGLQRTEFLRRAVRTAASITDAERLAWAFEAFQDQLTPDLLDEALEAFAAAEASFGTEWRAFGRARYLVVALPHLQPPRRDAVHDEILRLIKQLPEASLRRDVLLLLAENGDTARFNEVVELVEAETDPFERGLIAGSVLERAPEVLRDRLVMAALAELENIKDPYFQSVTDPVENVISRVMPYTHNPRQMLGAVSQFESEEWKRTALLRFARAMRADLFDDLLTLATALERAGYRAEVLTTLAAVAPAERRTAVLGGALAGAIGDQSDLLHDDVLPPLAQALVLLPPATIRALWHDQRSRLGELARPQLLRKLHGLAAAILHADAEAASTAVEATLDVQRWWP